MCEDRDARFFAPPPEYLRDNAGMIAMLGAQMYAAGDTVDIEASAVDQGFRPDEVPVTWRAGEPSPSPDEGPVRGAEAVVEVGDRTVRKRRIPKTYRHPGLDRRLRRERTVAEARLTAAARHEGVPTPVVYDVDVPEATLCLQRVGACDLRDAPTERRVRAVARHLVALHEVGIVHGDPTARNVRVAQSGQAPSGGAAEDVFLIDFGLGYHTDDREDYAMDLHVLQGSLRGTASGADRLCAAVEAAYRRAGGDPATLERLADIGARGRYQ